MKFQIIDEEVLFRIAVELRLSGTNGAFEGRRGDGGMPKFMEHEVHGRDIKKGMLADDRVVPFEDILIIGVPPIAFFERLVDTSGIRLFVALPIRKACSPAIFNWYKVKALLGFAGSDAGCAGVSEWRADERFDEFRCGGRRSEFAGGVILGRRIQDFG